MSDVYNHYSVCQTAASVWRAAVYDTEQTSQRCVFVEWRVNEKVSRRITGLDFLPRIHPHTSTQWILHSNGNRCWRINPDHGVLVLHSSIITGWKHTQPLVFSLLLISAVEKSTQLSQYDVFTSNTYRWFSTEYQPTLISIRYQHESWYQPKK